MLGDGFDQQMCQETRASRKMLIPLVVVSVVLVVVGVADAVLRGKKGTAIADLRVEKLRQEDENWEDSTVFKSMRSVEKP
jgi:flagellar basal body-associated protein FliL